MKSMLTWGERKELEAYKGLTFSLVPSPEYKAKEKETNAGYIVRYMINRVRRMFKWNNLPETVSERALETYLISNGNVCWAEHEGKLYVFVGGLGGKPDPYYMPTLYTVANPALGFSKMYKINEDCIVMPNDTCYQGLMPLIGKYASLIAETELSIYSVDVLMRSALVFVANGETEKKSIDTYINSLKDGELSVILNQKTIPGAGEVTVQPGATTASQSITDLIELEQYLKAALFNELGLNANWNAKRETLTSSEVMLNEDTLLPLIDDMLLCRQEFAEKVNAMFGTNITVEFASAWAIQEEEIELQMEQTEAEVENIKNEDEESSSEISDEVEENKEEEEVKEVEDDE